MADAEQLALLKKSVSHWNARRKDDPYEVVDLRVANLRHADLTQANLRGADLRGAKLLEVVLTRANLQNADLQYAELQGANLIGADLTGADLTGAELRGADLHDADLQRAILEGANLRQAILQRAKLPWAYLRGAKLQNAYLQYAELQNANLIGADLQHADLHATNLQNADLQEADLQRADLHGAKLEGADLTQADLTGAHLQRADLRGAKLLEVVLTRANLQEADLSGATLSDLKRIKGIKGVQLGINGLYSKTTDSAALMTMTPPGNSMQGSNADAVLESLMRARRLHGYSLSFTALALAILFLGLPDIKVSALADTLVTNDQFLLIALLVSLGSYALSKSFLEDALRGVRYLQDRDSAMRVGLFPWSLSRFTGERLDRKVLSFVVRFVLAFHPLAYVFFFRNPVPIAQDLPPYAEGLPYYWAYGAMAEPALTAEWYHWMTGVLILVFAIWLFYLSQEFQRPILFDNTREQERKSDVEALGIKLETEIRALHDTLKTRLPEKPEGEQT